MCQGSLIPNQPLPENVRRAERKRLQAILRERGYSATARRLAVYDVLLEVNDHICAEHILEDIQEKHPAWHVNKTTVYRTLDLLQELGLVYEMRHTDGRAQYELTLHGPHGHLFCTVCGRVQDVDVEAAAAFRQALCAKQGFDVDLVDNALLGLCAQCASRVNK